MHSQTWRNLWSAPLSGAFEETARWMIAVARRSVRFETKAAGSARTADASRGSIARVLRCGFAICVGMMAPHADAFTITETFNSDPAARGWRVFGDSSLFAWSAAG